MIHSAEEFVRLRDSTELAEYQKAAWDEAPIEVWQDVIAKYPDYKKWVVHNKTVPLEILAQLINDSDAEVRCWIAQKRKITLEMQMKLAKDPEENVRAKLIYNGKINRQVWDVLSQDPSAFIQKSLKEKHQADTAIHPTADVDAGTPATFTAQLGDH